MVCEHCGTEYNSYTGLDVGMCMLCTDAYKPNKIYVECDGVSGAYESKVIYIGHRIYPPGYFERLGSGFTSDKHCKKCGNPYTHSNSDYCPECRPVDINEYRAKNKEEIAKQKHEYYIDNKNKIVYTTKKWRQSKLDIKEIRHQEYLRRKTRLTGAMT
jgi:uncharacterized Zn finger protein (UPF0148 family)